MALVLQGATLVDGTGADPVVSAMVVIDAERITAAGAGVSVPPDAEVIDVTGMTLTPGLIDAHVHLGISTDINATVARQLSVAEIAAAMFDNCRQTIEAGFTTVRDTGGIDGGIVRAVDSGRVLGPRISQSGAILCQTGGHGHFCSAWEPVAGWLDREIPGLTTLSFPVDGPDEVRKAARENFRRGADFLKMCVTGGVVSMHDKLTDTQFTVAEIRAAVVEARARGTYVTVHAHNNQGVRNALEAGVACVEHGTAIDAETAELMAADDVAFVPTLAVAHLLAANVAAAGLAPQIAERVRGVEDGMANGILAARTAGVRVGSGSDLIGPDQSQRGLELVLRSAVTDPMEALVAATSINAGILGLGDDLGTVAGGKLADLVAWSESPLESPDRFNDRDAVALVVKGGQVIKDTRK